MALVEEVVDNVKSVVTGKGKWFFIGGLGLVVILVFVTRSKRSAPVTSDVSVIDDGEKPTGYETYPQYPDTENVEWREGIQALKDQLKTQEADWTDKMKMQEESWRDMFKRQDDIWSAENAKDDELARQRQDALTEELRKLKEKFDGLDKPEPQPSCPNGYYWDGVACVKIVDTPTDPPKDKEYPPPPKDKDDPPKPDASKAAIIHSFGGSQQGKVVVLQAKLSNTKADRTITRNGQIIGEMTLRSGGYADFTDRNPKNGTNSYILRVVGRDMVAKTAQATVNYVKPK